MAEQQPRNRQEAEDQGWGIRVDPVTGEYIATRPVRSWLDSFPDSPHEAAVGLVRGLTKNTSGGKSGVLSAEGPIAFFNRGITRGATLGMGTDLLDKGFRRMGGNIPEREPEGLWEKASQGAGMAVGAVPPLISGAGALAMRGGRYLPEISRVIRNPFMKNPVASIATEAAAGAGAGAGEEIAGPEYGTLGSLVGGVGAGLGGNVVSRLSPTANPARTYNTAKNATKKTYGTIRDFLTEGFAPFGEEGATLSASRQIRARTPDPVASASRVSEPSLADPPSTSSQRTGDRDIIALERELVSNDTVAREALEAQLKDTQTSLGGQLSDLSGTNEVEALVVSARRRADDRMGNMGGGASEDAAAIYRQELEDSYQNIALPEENRLWRKAPDEKVSTGNLFDAYQEMWDSSTRVSKGDIPPLANKHIPRKEPVDVIDPDDLLGDPKAVKAPDSSNLFGEFENQREIHTFVSKMGEIRTKALLDGNLTLARNASLLGEAGWADLLGEGSPRLVSDALGEARAYSRNLNQTFRRGNVARILKLDSQGGATHAPTESLLRSLGKRGDAGAAVTSDQLIEAVGFNGRDPSKGTEAVRDYLRSRFSDSAILANGTYDASKANRFIQNNKALLDKHPQLRDQMEQAAQGLTSSEGMSGAAKTVSGIMDSSSPLDRLRRESDIANGPHSQSQEYADRVNEWRKVYRAAVMDYSLYKGGALDKLGNRTPNAGRLLSIINQGKTKGVFKELFTSEQLSRLEKLAVELDSSQAASGPLSPTIAGDARPIPSGIARIRGGLTILARLKGAQAGARAAGGTTGAHLSAASTFSAQARKSLHAFLNRHMDKLLVDAMQDPELFQKLLTMEDAPVKETASAWKAIKAWGEKYISSGKKEIASAFDEMIVPSAMGATAASMPERTSPRDPSPTGTMADIMPQSLSGRIKSGQTAIGHPLTQR